MHVVVAVSLLNKSFLKFCKVWKAQYISIVYIMKLYNLQRNICDVN